MASPVTGHALSHRTVAPGLTLTDTRCCCALRCSLCILVNLELTTGTEPAMRVSTQFPTGVQGIHDRTLVLLNRRAIRFPPSFKRLTKKGLAIDDDVEDACTLNT